MTLTLTSESESSQYILCTNEMFCTSWIKSVWSTLKLECLRATKILLCGSYFSTEPPFPGSRSNNILALYPSALLPPTSYTLVFFIIVNTYLKVSSEMGAVPKHWGRTSMALMGSSIYSLNKAFLSSTFLLPIFSVDKILSKFLTILLFRSLNNLISDKISISN